MTSAELTLIKLPEKGLASCQLFFLENKFDQTSFLK